MSTKRELHTWKISRCAVNLAVGPVCGEAEVQRDCCVEKRPRKEIAVLKRDLEKRPEKWTYVLKKDVEKRPVYRKET